MTPATINEELELFVMLKYNVPEVITFKATRELEEVVPYVVQVVRRRRMMRYLEFNPYKSYAEYYRDTLIEVLCEYELDPDKIIEEAKLND